MIKTIDIHTKSIVAVGDLHGYFNDIGYFIKSYNFTDTTIIFCGDIGMGFCKPEHYKTVFNKISRIINKRNVHLIFLRGNHDNPLYFDGNFMSKSKCIHFVKDYTVINFYKMDDTDKINEPYSVLAVGGGLSIDRTMRIRHTKEVARKYMRYHNGVNLEMAYKECPQCYWSNEMPVYDEASLNEIKDNGINIRVICTHTSPDFTYPFTKEGIRGWLLEDDKLEEDLNKERQVMTNLYEKVIADGHPLEIWCYGHYHIHNTEIIDNVKFYLLDMDRNGVMDFVEIYRNDNETNENIIP